MRVILQQIMAGPGGVVLAGQEADLPDEVAGALLASGQAKPAGERKAPAPVEVADAPAPEAERAVDEPLPEPEPRKPRRMKPPQAAE